MGGKANVRNLEYVIKNLEGIGERKKEQLMSSMQAAGDVLLNAVKEKISFNCHSLADLRRMGHPYAKRFPMDSGPHEDQFVHTQSGALLKSVSKIVELQGNRALCLVAVDVNIAPHAQYLLDPDHSGRQRVRDFLGWTWKEKKETIVAMIKHGLQGTKGRPKGAPKNVGGGGSRGGVVR